MSILVGAARALLAAAPWLLLPAFPAGAIEVVVGVLGATGIGGVITQIFVSLISSFVIGALSQALSKKPKVPEFSTVARERALSVRQAISPRRIVYGQVRVGGTYVFIHTTGGSNQYLHLVIAIAGHSVESISDPYFDGVQVPLDGSGNATGDFAGYVRCEKRLGTSDQTAFDGLVAAAPDKWTSAHRLRGVACAYLRLEWNASKFPNGIPNITFLVEGKNDIFDPRDDSTGYTANAALCVADYLASARYGLGAAYGTEIDEDALIEAANVCDETVALDANSPPDDSEPRFECAGTFESSEKPYEVLQRLLSAMAGRAVYSGGKWIIRAGAWRTPSVTLTADDFIAPLKITSRLSRRENFNGVKGVFVSPDNDWQPDDFPAYSRQTYLDEDQGERQWKDIDLPFTTSVTMAQRLAKIELERARRQITVQATCKLGAWRLQVGDTVRVTLARMGWTNKTFELVESTLKLVDGGGGPAFATEITLRELDAQAFEWASTEAGDWPAKPATTLPNPFASSAPTGLAVASAGQALLAPDGTVIPRLLVSWTPPASAFLVGYEVQWRLADGAGTNLALYSADITNGAWVSAGTPVVANTSGGFTIEDNSASVEEGKYQDVAFSGDSAVFSVRVPKAAAAPTYFPRIVAALYVQGASPASITQWNLSLNPYTGAAGTDGATPSGATYGVISDGDDWRIWAIVPNTIGADRAQLYLFPTSYSTIAAGAASGYSTGYTGTLEFSAPDIKVGSAVTSPVPTTGAAAAGPNAEYDNATVIGPERRDIYLQAGIESGRDYDVRVRARYSFGTGVVSAWASLADHTAGGKTTASDPVTGVAVTAVAEGLLVQWTNPADTDLRHTEVWVAAVNSRGSATKVAEVAASAFLIANVPSGATRYVWLRAVDTSGNQSDWSAGATSGDSGTAVPPAEATSITGQGAFATVDSIDDSNVDLLIEDAAIKNAKIQSLEAGKITTGSLDVDTTIEVRDQNGSPGTLRVKMGKLGGSPEDYGLNIYSEAGELIVGSTGLGLQVVGSANIADLAVQTIKIEDAAVIRKTSSSTTSNVSVTSGVGSWQQLLTVTHDSEGEEALLFINVAFAHNFNTAVDAKIDIRVRRTSPSGVTYEQINALTVPYLASETSSTLVAFYRFSGTIGALSSGNNTIVVEAAVSASSGTGRATAKDRSIMVIEPLK